MRNSELNSPLTTYPSARIPHLHPAIQLLTGQSGHRGDVDDSDLRFPSKIDWWVLAIPIVVVVGVSVSILSTTKAGQLHVTFFIPLAISVMVPFGIFASIFKSTLYVISGNELRIKCGPMKMLIPIDSISRIASSRSVASAPALSISRLAIQYGRFKEVLISPADRRGFIRALLAKAPNVVLEDLDEYR
jgi:hypothetical protein